MCVCVCVFVCVADSMFGAHMKHHKRVSKSKVTSTLMSMTLLLLRCIQSTQAADGTHQTPRDHH